MQGKNQSWFQHFISLLCINWHPNMADAQGCILLCLIWLILSILLRRLFTNRTSSHLPPSPLALPIIGHLHLLLPIPHQALHKLSTLYGPLIHLYLGSVPCVVVSFAWICQRVPENSWNFLFQPTPIYYCWSRHMVQKASLLHLMDLTGGSWRSCACLNFLLVGH